MIDAESESRQSTPVASTPSTSRVCTPSTSRACTPSQALSKGPQEKRRRLNREEQLDEAILEGLRESRMRRERREEAKAAENNADMYFGKYVGETLHEMAPRQKAIAKSRIQQVLLEVQFPEEL